MKYKIAKAFTKQTAKIKDPKILAKIRKTIEQIGEATALQDIPALEPLQSFTNYYRIKFDYHLVSTLERRDACYTKSEFHTPDCQSANL
jgi:hypothetical protein